MSQRRCQDCGEPVEYGRGWGGGGVCYKCRAKRANASRTARMKLSGKTVRHKGSYDPLEAR